MISRKSSGTGGKNSVRGVGSRLWRLLAFVLAAAFLLAACGKKSSPGKGDGGESSDVNGPGASSSAPAEEPGDGADGEGTDEPVDSEPADDGEDGDDYVDDGGDNGGEDEEDDGADDMSNAEITGYDLHELLKANRRLIATLEAIDTVPFPTLEEAGKTPQGGYFDGRYYYQAFINIVNTGDEADNEDVVVKYDTVTKKIVAQSEILKMSHANDITYNPKTNRFIVTHCMGTTSSKITVLTPDLKPDGDPIDVGFAIAAISYNAARDQYVALTGQTFIILDKDFKRVNVYDPTTRTAGYTTQGISSDDQYIYFLFYQQNVIAVYDWDGNFISIIELETLGCEGENISIIGNDIYVGGRVSSLDIFKITSMRIEPEEEEE